MRAWPTHYALQPAPAWPEHGADRARGGPHARVSRDRLNPE